MKDNRLTLKTIVGDQLIKGNITQDDYGQRVFNIFHHIAACGTEVYGYSKYQCEECGHTEIHYGTCKETYCPSCGGRKRMDWVEQQKEKAIKAEAFHLVFTVPDKHLNRFALHSPKVFLNALFEASSKAVKKLAADPEFFGASVTGFFSVVHTWGSTLTFHPHIHMVLYGAGLDNQGDLVRVKRGKDFLFPAKKLAAEFKKRVLKILRKSVRQSGEEENFSWLDDFKDAESVDWNVQINKGLENPDAAVNYLGRYVNRVAISNSRLVSYDGEKVTFVYTDYRDHGKYQTKSGKTDRSRGKKKTMTLDVKEFLRRFVMHILPVRFKRIRFYGFLSETQTKTLEKMKELTGTGTASEEEKKTEAAAEVKIETEALDTEAAENACKNRCPKCGGEMKFHSSAGKLRSNEFEDGFWLLYFETMRNKEDDVKEFE